MPASDEKNMRTVAVGIGLIIVILSVAFVLSRVAPKSAPLPVIGTVAPFTLTNQNGTVTTLDDLRGNVWVADIVFSKCAGPCPQMMKRMESLQAALPARSRARLVTLTTDPDNDTPAVLKEYGAAFNADPARWTLLTGTKQQLGALAIDSLKLSAVEIKPEDRKDDRDLFVHSTYFVVVDRKARLRAVFESAGADVDWSVVRAKIVSTVQQLERE